jgi:hypothetical protein
MMAVPVKKTRDCDNYNGIRQPGKAIAVKPDQDFHEDLRQLAPSMPRVFPQRVCVSEKETVDVSERREALPISPGWIG